MSFSKLFEDMGSSGTGGNYLLFACYFLWAGIILANIDNYSSRKVPEFKLLRNIKERVFNIDGLLRSNILIVTPLMNFITI